jgi:regulator of replication initiation timing
MDKEQLTQDLTELLAEIDRLPLENVELRRLRSLVSEIEDHVEGRQEQEDSGEIVDAADRVIAHFETDHPGFTGALRRIMNALSSMGV